jgi:hypothetical protein
MSKQITISSLTGTSPYNIYLCNNTYSQCSWITTINNSSIPYSFLVPALYETQSVVGLKVQDADNCEIKKLVNL